MYFHANLHHFPSTIPCLIRTVWRLIVAAGNDQTRHDLRSDKDRYAHWQSHPGAPYGDERNDGHVYGRCHLFAHDVMSACATKERSSDTECGYLYQLARRCPLIICRSDCGFDSEEHYAEPHNADMELMFTKTVSIDLVTVWLLLTILFHFVFSSPRWDWHEDKRDSVFALGSNGTSQFDG